ncbi:MAG: hypothetical protein PHS82_14235, partial [Lachnospiraceae bacterium]|nr:hypothetical protein [Lachnospiraceae bacterium]
IIPHKITDDEYAEAWLEKEYTGKTFSEGTAEIYSERGERVRSKSEKIIADMLNKRGIPYKYECPLQLNGIGIIYPDFTILNKQERKEIYLEHLGMMDNAEYCENALRRIDYYIKNEIMLGDQLLIIYETAKHPLNTSIVDKVIQSVTSK